MNTPDLPVALRRNADLFEIGFCFFLVPLLAASMDRSPFHVGSRILLWAGCWFLLKRLGRDEREQVLSSIAPFRRLVPALVALASLAAGGALLGVLLGAVPLVLPMAFGVPAYAVLTSLPVVLLAWAYVPVRFGKSSWLPGVFVALVPWLGFTGLHLSSGRWAPVALAALLGGVAWGIARFRAVPILSVVVVHAVVAWLGVVGRAW